MQNILKQMSEMLDDCENSQDKTVAEVTDIFSRLRRLIRQAQIEMHIIDMKQDHGCGDQPCEVCYENAKRFISLTKDCTDAR